MPVDPEGRIDLGALDLEDATVVACQSANHEVGTLQPVADLAARLDGVPLFVDACASAGRMPLPEGWSALAASAHKWGGPAGVGVLAVRRGARWREPFPEDDRSGERESGFENVPAILAAAAALQAVVAERDAENARQRGLVDRIRRRAAGIPDVEVVGAPEDRLPHLVTFSCLYVDGEALVTELDRQRLRGGERVGLHVVGARAEPRAGRDGRPHPRERAGVGRSRDHAGRRRALRGDAPSGGRQPPRTPVMLELDCRGQVCPAPIIELARRIGDVAVGELVGVVAGDAAARYDVPAWCRMTGQEYVGEETTDDGVPALRRTPGQVRWAPTSSAASSPYDSRIRSTNCSALKAYSWVPTVSTT